MPLLLKDYTNLVFKAYEEKRNANLLSRLLMHPTTANIKQDCLNVYNDRINKGQKEEENILTAFFSVPPAGRNFGYVIGRHSPDKFRPLQSFIKGEIKNPSLATVELLAWLIDFNPRPLAYAQKVLGVTTDATIYGSSITNNDVGRPEPNHVETDSSEIYLGNEKIKDSENLPQDELDKTSTRDEEYADVLPIKNAQNWKLKIAATTTLVLATILGGVYMTKNDIVTNTHCMYWAADHFEGMLCTEEKKGSPTLPMDSTRMKNFKKITRTDTITEQSIGKVYYLKTNKVLEYFTTGGNHPVDTSRELHPLSPYIYNKYLKKDTASNK